MPIFEIKHHTKSMNYSKTVKRKGVPQAFCDLLRKNDTFLRNIKWLPPLLSS